MGELIFCSVIKYDFSTYVRLYVCNDIYVYVTNSVTLQPFYQYH